MNPQKDQHQSPDFRKAVLEARNEATPDGVLVVDQKGKILLHNKNFAGIWGMPEEIIESNDDEAALKFAMTVLVDPEGFIARVKYIYAHPDKTSYDEIYFKDGRIIERYGKAVVGEDDTYFGWAWFFRDITERKQQARRHQKILESLPHMAWTAKANGAVDYLNRRWYAYTGQKEEEALGNGWANAISPGVEDAVFEKWQYCLQHGVPYEVELKYRRYDGEFKWHLTRAEPIKEGAEITLWVGTCTDIDDQKRAEELLEQRVKERTADLERERTLATSVLNTSINGVVAMDAVTSNNGEVTDFVITIVNKAFTDITGLGANIVGKNHLSVFPTTVGNGLFETLKQVYRTGEPVRTEFHSFLGGTDSYYDLSAAKRGSQGIVITFSDITQQRKSAIELEEQKNLLESVLRHSPAGITVYEAIRNDEGIVVDFQCILANDAAENFTGISNKDRFQKTILETTPALKNSPLFNMAVKAIDEASPFRTEYHNEALGKWLELSVVKIFDNHLVNVFRDISPIKETQIELEKHVEELKRTNANLEEFAYAASHDLKEPVRKISVFSDRIKTSLQESLTDEHRRYFERMDFAVLRMTSLIDDLLLYSYVTKGASLEKEVDLNNKVALVLQDLELEIEQRHAKVIVDPLPVITGHRRQLQQLFHNLIGNALKYSKPGVPPEIHISSRKMKGSDTPLKLTGEEAGKSFHLIEVKDHGVGFEQKDAENIFKVFTRLHWNSQSRGTGVGLSIVQKIVFNHDGHVWAESNPGEGARFFILLPADES